MKYSILLFTFLFSFQFMVTDILSQYKLSGNKLIYNNKTIQLDEYNILLDGNIKNVKSKYVFNDVNTAFSTLKSGTDAKHRMTLYVAPYVYWIDNPDDETIRKPKDGEQIPVGRYVDCSWLSIEGLTDSPENVVFASNRGQMQGAIGNYTMFLFNGDGLRLRNLTLGNYCNVDLEYLLNPTLNKQCRNKALTQAQLAIVKGDKVEAHNCRFVGRQNASPLNGARRTLFEKCYFEIADDALCGTAVYLDCTFALYGSRPFYSTSETGSVILNSDFNIMHESEQFLTNVPSPVILVDCRFHSKTLIKLGWTPHPSYDLRCYKYNVTYNNSVATFSEKMPAITVDMENKNILRAFKCYAGNREIYNTYNLLFGDDGWDPMNVGYTIRKIEREHHVKLTNLPICLTTQVDTMIIVENGNMAHAHAVARRFGDYPTKVGTLKWQFSRTDVSDMNVEENNKVQVWSTNKTDYQRQLSIIATDELGIEGSATLISQPSKLPPPSFTNDGNPTIDNLPYGCMVNYHFDSSERYDQSKITWYRCENANGDNAVAVSVSRDNRPAFSYLYQPGDVGYYIKAEVRPKNLRSDFGQKQSVVSAQCVEQKQVIDDIIYTDFHDFPTEYQPYVRPGFWTLDGYKPKDTKNYAWNVENDNWTYDKGTDGAQDYGLMPPNPGARMRYTPTRDKYGDMSLTINIDPCKSDGQGFEGYDGQYMDVCIKFDTQRLTGYGLRIERATKCNNAVNFTLVEYKNGNAVPISNSITTSCYRSTCQIKLWTKSGHLYAHAESDAHPVIADNNEVKQMADLNAKITNNACGGILIQYTGVGKTSTSLLRSLLLKWEK